jgi:hypothetical protein
MRIRINQLECRYCQGRYEIFKWFPNSYYGAEAKYLEDGYVLSGGFYNKDNVSIGESCFKNSESCFTVATLHYDNEECCCDMRTVGPRVLNLDKQERADFFDVYAMAEDRIHREARLKEMMKNNEEAGLYQKPE